MQCYSLGYHKVCCTNIGFVQCFSFGSRKGSVTRFCYALVSVFCLTNSGFVQCYPLSSRKICRKLLFNLFYSVILVLRALPHKHRACAVLFPRLPWSVLHACVYFALFSNFLLCVFCLASIGFVQCFFLRLPLSLHPFGFLCFIQFAFVMRALPNKLRFVQWFFPGSPRICTLYFLLCIIQF